MMVFLSVSITHGKLTFDNVINATNGFVIEVLMKPIKFYNISRFANDSISKETNDNNHLHKSLGHCGQKHSTIRL
jgi:hypothetical protein